MAQDLIWPIFLLRKTDVLSSLGFPKDNVI